VHLTAWELRRTPYHFSTESAVLVCGNRRVLEAVAERGSAGGVHLR
jgi:hypothetical protein